MKDKIIFKFESNTNEFQPTFTLVFENEGDMHITTLHKYCKAFAAALGFSDETINKMFGEDCSLEDFYSWIQKN